MSEDCLMPFAKKLSSVLTIVKTIAPINAGTIPSIENPGTIHAANPNISAFTTNANSPNVTSVNGNETNFTTGFINPFTTPTTKAAIIKVVLLFTPTPGTICVTI